MTSPGTSSLRGRGDPFAVALHPRLDRQPGLQRLDRVAGLALFPEADDGVGDQQHQDDEEVGPVRTTPDSTTATSIIQGIGPQK
jgi:hypothetical protein